MKKLLLFVFILRKKILFWSILTLSAIPFCMAQSLGIGTPTPNNSAILDVQSNSKGMLIPRMTTAQRAAISSPATGLLIFDNTTESFWFKSAGNWIELVDTLNNVWKKNGADAYVGVTGNVGIGTNVPGYSLHLSRPNPRIGLTDTRDGSLSGYLEGNFLDLNVNASRVVLGGTPGNLTLQTNSAPFVLAGNVGIGTLTPTAKLQVEGGTGTATTGGGYLQLGTSNSINVGFDNNEIQSRNNGAASKLYMQTGGGDLQIGGTNNIIIKEGNQVHRSRPLSSPADLLPIAYAKVSASGVVTSGTGNLSVSKIADGEYRILFLGENNLYTNKGLYTIITTINNDGLYPAYSASGIRNDNAIYVYTARPKFDWTNVAVDGQIASYIQTIMYHYGVDSDFSIIIYKM